jgi:hypothetical protein
LDIFFNKYHSNQRKAIGEKDFLNSKELYAPFRDIDIAILADINTGETVKKAVELPPDTRRSLENIDLSYVVLA